MVQPIYRYPLDPTGNNPDNAVVNEIHTLSNAQEVRAVSPIYGPFFSESMFVFDSITGRRLDRGRDYQCVELLQEATSRFGKEICCVVLILDRTVSENIRINYQVLGGLFANDSSSIVSLYETVMKDNRPIFWPNVLNKPAEYPPALHRHLLEDLVGFEPIVVALERIRNAIILQDVPAYEALIDWVNSKLNSSLTYEDIDNVADVNKIVTFDKLLYALTRLNFNGISITPSIGGLRRKKTLMFNISCTNWSETLPLYWTIEHETSQGSDFATTSGVINIVGNRGVFSISALSALGQNLGPGKFRIAIRKNGINGPILLTTGVFTIPATNVNNRTIDYMNACCLYSRKTRVSAKGLFITG